jgi:hypothetical protein
MTRTLAIAATCLIASPASAGFNDEWTVPFAEFDVPATFHFQFERAGMETGLDITLTDQETHLFDWHINADNADSYGIDWALLREIAGGPEVINYHGWWNCDVEISNSPFDPIPAGRKMTGLGANQPNFYPEEFRLTFFSSPANRDLSVRMIIENARIVPEPTSLILLLLVMPIGMMRRRPYFAGRALR